MRTMQIVRREHRVHCSTCGAALFTVKDTRFGLAPSDVICRPCTLAALRPE